MTNETRTAMLRQGDPRLLDHPVAQQLLASTELGRLAYLGRDGAPRVIPVGFVWNGTEIVIATYAQSAKVPALRARPQVALTIDRPGPPPEVLTIRGRIDVGDAGGVPIEYRQMQERYYGPDQAAAAVSQLEQSGTRMVRLALRPDWVGVLDFRTRFPGAFAASA